MFAARTDELDRLAENNTRITRVLADHRLSIGRSISNLRAVSEAVRNSKGDLEELFRSGPAFLTTTADLVADQKANLDCLLTDLAPRPAPGRDAGPPGRSGHPAREGPAGLRVRVPGVDREPDGPWIRVNLALPVGGTDPKIYTPRGVAPGGADDLAVRLHDDPGVDLPGGARGPSGLADAAARARSEGPAEAFVPAPRPRSSTTRRSDCPRPVRSPHPRPRGAGWLRRPDRSAPRATWLTPSASPASCWPSAWRWSSGSRLPSWAWSPPERTTARRATSRRCERRPARSGVALLTYDFHDPDDHKQRVLALATGSFRGEYESAFDQGLGDLITKVQATSEGFVKDVYVSQIDQERGEAIVRADVTRNGAGGERTLFDIYLLLTFVHVDDAWKVDQVTDLNFATEGDQGTSADGTTTPSTPVP